MRVIFAPWNLKKYTIRGRLVSLKVIFSKRLPKPTRWSFGECIFPFCFIYLIWPIPAMGLPSPRYGCTFFQGSFAGPCLNMSHTDSSFIGYQKHRWPRKWYTRCMATTIITLAIGSGSLCPRCPVSCSHHSFLGSSFG